MDDFAVAGKMFSGSLVIGGVRHRENEFLSFSGSTVLNGKAKTLAADYADSREFIFSIREN
jgi:hypothetical protein